jgi:hypothetical protein
VLAIVRLHPHRQPEAADIEPGVASLQAEVGGYFEELRSPLPRTVAIVRDHVAETDAINVVIAGHIIRGPLIVYGLDDAGEARSLNAREIAEARTWLDSLPRSLATRVDNAERD